MGEREGFACVACGQGGGVADVCACDSQWDGGKAGFVCGACVCVGALQMYMCVHTCGCTHRCTDIDMLFEERKGRLNPLMHAHCIILSGPIHY